MWPAFQTVDASHGVSGYSVHVNAAGFFQPPLPQPQDLQRLHRAPGSLPGQHLLAEFHGAASLNDVDFIREALRRAAERAEATVLALHHHLFTPDSGVTAFALLAESHISIHTWPEQRYAALDIFMCGRCDPLACLPTLAMAFQPARLILLRLVRGSDASEAVPAGSATN